MKKILKKCWLYVIGVCLAFALSAQMTALAAGIDVTNVSFTMCDMRTGETEAFTGGNGRYAVVLFGRTASCAYTKAALKAVTKIAEYADMSQLDIYVFDVTDTEVATLSANLEELGVSDKVMVMRKNDAASGATTMYSDIIKAANVSSSFYFPAIGYINPKGELYLGTTGRYQESEIVENLKAGGFAIEKPIVDYTLKVEGTSRYDVSYLIFDLVNEERTAAGSEPLEMDQDLMEAAALRAAECATYYSATHNRPTGETCFTVHDKVNGENIAFMSGQVYDATAQILAKNVMTMWMNSQGHKENILRESFTTIGVGAFVAGDTIFFTQNFGVDVEVAAVTTEAKAVAESFTYSANADYAKPLIVSEVILDVGEEVLLGLGVVQSEFDYLYTDISPDTFEWSTSDATCVAVDQEGCVEAKRAGTATITATNRDNAKVKLQCKVMVLEPEPTPTPEPTATPTPEPTATPTPKPTATPTPEPTATPTPAPTATPTPKPTATPTPKPTATPTPKPTTTPGQTTSATIYGGVDYAPVYDATYYKENNPDVANAFQGNEALMLKHFVECGMSEGRQGSAEFHLNTYKSNYGDVAAAFGSDNKSYYIHYINCGKAEGRTAVNSGNTGGNAGNGSAGGENVYNGVDYSLVYDKEFYGNANPDVAGAFNGNAEQMLKHFVECGMSEGRQASANFDLNVYRSQNGDVAAAFGSDNKSYYMHYINCGKAEGRVASGNSSGQTGEQLDYSMVFDAEFYANTYGDIKAAFGSDANALLNHFVQYGMGEGRQGSANFNARVYKAKYGDLSVAYGDTWAEYYKHYIKYGYAEGRVGK